MPDLGAGIVIASVAFVLGMAKILRGPVGEALGDRLRHGPRTRSDAALMAEVDELKTRLAEMEERLDFAERLLAAGRETDQLPGGARQ
jgi:ubiquinone biosynthesis protein UbiJ